MKQILQSFKTGETFLEDLPSPNLSKGSVLIETSHSLVSKGTESMLVEFGKSSLLAKTRQQPEKVVQVLDKMRKDGVLPTLEAVFNKLEQPIPLGYSNVGVVLEVGEGVFEFAVGDRVASNGSHAEIVSVPKNLIAKIPENVVSEDATFTVIGSIGLQSIRLLNPTFDETIVVYGLGLIGLITCQLLKANGCNVIGVDIDDQKLKLAKRWCSETINSKINNPIKRVIDLSNGVGCDGVIITATDKSDEILSNSAQMSRKRGKIILVGVVGLNLNRTEFYEKELSFQVSCSYGPGRYDPQYENNGIDYPLPYVRWTEQRNFQTILNAIDKNILNVKDLITKKVNLKDYLEVYDDMKSKNSIGSVLVYPKSGSKLTNKTIKINQRKYPSAKGVVGIIGAGNFTSSTILPLLKRADAKIKCIVSSNGLSGTRLAKKYGIPKSSTDYKEIFKDDEIDSVIITTRHDTHAKFVLECLEMGKNTFVEKPLCLNLEELNKIESLLSSIKTPMLTVGFNRRFSPHLKLIKNSIGENSGPINISATMNAGHIPKDHWVQDFGLGGGRIIGEACHLIDALVFLTGSLVHSVCVNSLGNQSSINTDNASIIIKFENGSNGIINYFSNGSKKYSKERLEVYSQNRTWTMDNYKKTELFGVKNFKNLKTKLDKGHSKQFENLIKKIREGGNPLIPISELMNVTKASFACIESIKTNKWIEIC